MLKDGLSAFRINPRFDPCLFQRCTSRQRRLSYGFLCHLLILLHTLHGEFIQSFLKEAGNL